MNAPVTGLSCCIITKNEALLIGDCIRAVADLASDIVVVDSGSTDDTVAIAEALGARVIHHYWPGFGPQKRYAEDCARFDWILNVDADEMVTPELAREIKALLKAGPELHAYKFRIRNVYPNQSKPRLWADFHNYVRLYNRRVVRFRESTFHDTVDTKTEKVGQLKASVIHFSARSYEHIRQKLDAYGNLQAKVMRKPAWVLWSRVPFEYPLTFIRYFVFRRHFTGGWDGVYSTHLAAESRVKRLFKILAAKKAAGQHVADKADGN